MFGGCYMDFLSMRKAEYNTKAYYLSSYYSLNHFGNPVDLDYSPLILSIRYSYMVLLEIWNVDVDVEWINT